MNVKDLQPNKPVDSLEAEVVGIDEPREFTNFRGSGELPAPQLKTRQVRLNLLCGTTRLRVLRSARE